VSYGRGFYGEAFCFWRDAPVRHRRIRLSLPWKGRSSWPNPDMIPPRIGGVLAGATPISTGRAGFETPTGTFRVQQKVANYRSSQYGSYVDAHGHIVMRDVDRKADPMPPGTRFVGARMPWFLRVTEGIGLHQGHLPGYPASHGCIRLPGSMAQLYFQAASVGTPVTIVP
jgi:lipoprotein-anchoring transpeptidase ErfK/SrfK